MKTKIILKRYDKNSILRKYNKINEYDEYDNEEDKYIGYNRFLLKQLKSNQHAEKIVLYLGIKLNTVYPVVIRL